jgi:hypothetical protein
VKQYIKPAEKVYRTIFMGNTQEAFDLCQWMLHNLAIYNSTNKTKGVLEKVL